MLVVCVCAVNTCTPQNQNCFPITSGHILAVYHLHHLFILTHTLTAILVPVSPSATFSISFIHFHPLESLFFLFIHLFVSFSLVIVVIGAGGGRKCEAGRDDQIVPVLLSLNCCNLTEARRNCV